MQTLFKELTIAPGIAADPRLLRDVESASNLLESVVGKGAGRLHVAWSSAGRDNVELRLADAIVDGSVVVPADELRSEARLRHRMWTLWDDMLGRRVEALIEPIIHPNGASAVP